MSDVIIVNVETEKNVEDTPHTEKELLEKTEIELNLNNEKELLEKTEIELSSNDEKKDIIQEESKKCLNTLIEKFLDDGVIDNNELTEIIKVVIELVEEKTTLSGTEKKNLSLSILRQFLESKMSNYDEIEKQISKSIDFAVKVSKEGFGEIKIMSSTISDLKTGFNFIYSSTMSKIEEKYPLTDDITNNLFDIIIIVMRLIEGQTSMNENEKAILLKKIVIKIISSLVESTKLTKEQGDLLISQVDSTIAIAQVGIRAKNGEIRINPREVVSIFECIFTWFRKCRPNQGTVQ